MISSVLSWLGFGGSALTVSLIVGAIYLYRGAKIIKLVGALFSSVISTAITILVLSGIALWMGWIEISPMLLIEDVIGAISWMLGSGVDLLRRLIGVFR